MASTPETKACSYSFVENFRMIVRVPPPATFVLFVTTVAAYIGQVLGGSSEWQRAIGIIPAKVADTSSFLRLSDTQTLPAWLTLFSYMFLHSGVFHLLTNMVCLWMFGILAESLMGTKRFAITYLAFGVITGMAIVAIIPYWTSPIVGASGAISEVFGTFLALRFSERLDQRSPTAVVLMLEAIPLLTVVAWFVVRHTPLEPDRTSSVAWHLIPFLLAWYSVRTWKQYCLAAKR